MIEIRCKDGSEVKCARMRPGQDGKLEVMATLSDTVVMRLDPNAVESLRSDVHPMLNTFLARLCEIAEEAVDAMSRRKDGLPEQLMHAIRHVRNCTGV